MNMISITNNLNNCKENTDRNLKVMQLIKTNGKKKWVQLLVNGLNIIGSIEAKLIIYNNPQLKRLAENIFAKNIKPLNLQ